MQADGTSAVTYTADDSSDGLEPVHELTLNAATWSDTALPGADGYSPAGYVRADGVTAVVYAGFDQHVHEEASTPSGWVDTDLTTASQSPTLTGGYAVFPTVVPLVRSDGVSAVYYGGWQDNHLHELSFWNGAWHDADISVAAHITDGPWGLTGFTDGAGHTSIVWGSVTDGQIHKTTFIPGHCAPSRWRWCVWIPGQWNDQDVSALAHTTSNGLGVASGYVRSDGVTAIDYDTSSGQLYEADLINQQWTATDILGAASPVTNGGGGPSGMVFKGGHRRRRVRRPGQSRPRGHP